MILLAWLLACQEPFGSDRHILEGFRIAGVRAPATLTSVSPEALVVVDGHVWADEPTQLVWAWIGPEEDPATWQGFGAATGPLPVLELPAGDERLLLIAIGADGTERRAVLDVGADRAATVGPLEVVRLPLSTDGLKASDLEVKARSKLNGEPDRTVDPGGFLRITEPDAGDRGLRWMSLDGTFFELEPAITDWVAATVVVDDEDIETSRDMDPGTVPMIALRPADQDGGGWAIADVHIGEPTEAGAWVSDRWIPGAIVGWQRAELAADPQSTTGVAALAPEPVPPGAVPTFDPRTDGCDEPPVFDPTWLANGACLRTAYLGRTVFFEGQDTP